MFPLPHSGQNGAILSVIHTKWHSTQQPKRRNFERDSYKIGTQNSASQEIFAKYSARIAPGYWG
jgi:hypothetical protein